MTEPTPKSTTTRTSSPTATPHTANTPTTTPPTEQLNNNIKYLYVQLRVKNLQYKLSD